MRKDIGSVNEQFKREEIVAREYVVKNHRIQRWRSASRVQFVSSVFRASSFGMIVHSRSNSSSLSSGPPVREMDVALLLLARVEAAVSKLLMKMPLMPLVRMDMMLGEESVAVGLVGVLIVEFDGESRGICPLLSTSSCSECWRFFRVGSCWSGIRSKENSVEAKKWYHDKSHKCRRVTRPIITLSLVL